MARPAIRTVRAAVVSSIVLALSCSAPRGRVGFLPDLPLAARGTADPSGGTWGGTAALPAAAPAPRARTQHTFGAVGEDLFPAPSPDGKSLLFATSRHGLHFALARMTIGTAALTLVTGGPASDIHPAVSPNGRRLAFASDRDDGWNLYLLEEGQAARRLTGRAGDAFGPSWAPDSRRLAFFRRGEASGDWEIWTTDVEGGGETRIGLGLFPAWSPPGPDGEWIAYQRARDRDGSWYSVWKLRPDGSHPTELVPGGSWGAVHPTWSPDGRWIAFAAVGKSPEARAGGERASARADDLYLAAADGSRLTNLTGDRPGVPEWNPAFGPDGRLYFNADDGGGVNIWSIAPLAGGASSSHPPREDD